MCYYNLQGLPGGVPRAIWKWQGKISRHLFDTVPFLLRESEVAGGCTHCTFVLRYKVIDGQLYTDRKRRCLNIYKKFFTLTKALRSLHLRQPQLSRKHPAYLQEAHQYIIAGINALPEAAGKSWHGTP